MEQSNGRRLSSPYLLALVALFAMTSLFDVCSGQKPTIPVVVLDALEGDTINIKCRAPPPPKKEREMLMWIKGNQLHSWQNIRWSNDSIKKYDSEYMLELYDVEMYEAGMYACTMKPGTVAQTMLKVRQRPRIVVETFEQTEGTSDEPQKIATCTVYNAKETDKVAWLREPEETNLRILKNENNTTNITIDYMTTDLSPLLNDVPATCTVTIPKFRYATGPAPRTLQAQAELKIKETTTPVPTTKPIAAPTIKKFARGRDEDQVTIREGMVDLFQCQGAGHPIPEMFWSFEGKVIQEAYPRHIWRNTLRLDNVKLEDAGVYKCTARSEVGEVSQEIMINIEAPPRFSRPGTEAEPDKFFIPADAEEAKLTCEVISNPKADITWEVPGAEASDFKTYYKYTPDNYSSVSVARIPHQFFSSDEDTKVYCVATSPAGNKRNTLLVKKEPRPALSSAVVAILVVVIIVLFALVLIGTVVVVRKRAASNGQAETVENGCASALLCGSKKPLESEADGKSEQVNDVVKEEDEELVAGEENEEKQHLTEATDNDTNEQTEVAAEEEKMLESPKKKINLTGSLGCCRRSRKKLQEDEDEDEVTGTDNKNGDAPSADGANANVDGNNEDGEAKNGAGLESITEEKKQPDEDKINDEEFDRDSGKGDTLKPMTEPVGAEDGEVATEVAESK